MRAAGWLPAALFLYASIVSTSYGWAQHTDSTVGGRPSRAEQLEIVRREIASLEGRLVDARSQAEGAAENLAATTLELELQRARVDEAVAAHGEAEEAFQAIAEEVDLLREKLGQLRDELRSRLVLFHRLGGRGYLRLLFSVRADGDPLSALRQLRFFILTDARALDRYRATRVDLEERREELLLRQREVEAWVDAEELRRVEVEQVRARQARLYDRLEHDRRTLQERTSELERREKSLARFIELIEREEEGAFAGAPIQDFRGALDWPLWGRLVTAYGPRKDPRYGTLVPNNGIEIGSAGGESVRAIFPGKVLFADVFQDYGYTVVVQHKGNVLTLYAGLRELVVNTGDMLDLGDAVGSSTELLYFEIRTGSEPENPSRWLR